MVVMITKQVLMGIIKVMIKTNLSTMVLKLMLLLQLIIQVIINLLVVLVILMVNKNLQVLTIFQLCSNPWFNKTLVINQTNNDIEVIGVLN